MMKNVDGDVLYFKAYSVFSWQPLYIFHVKYTWVAMTSLFLPSFQLHVVGIESIIVMINRQHYVFSIFLYFQAH